MVYNLHHILRKLSVPQTTPLLALQWIILQNCLLNGNVPTFNFCLATTLFKHSVTMANLSWHFWSLLGITIHDKFFMILSVPQTCQFHRHVSCTDSSSTWFCSLFLRCVMLRGLTWILHSGVLENCSPTAPTGNRKTMHSTKEKIKARAMLDSSNCWVVCLWCVSVS